MDSKILEEIVEEYERQRSENKNDRDRRIAKAYRLAPELREIDLAASRIGSATLQSILATGNSSAKADMADKFRVLRDKKAKLLRENKIPADYDKLKYKCNLCQDTGYIEGKGRCSCFRQKLIDRLYEQSNMKELLKNQGFEYFNLNYYSKKPVAGYKNTPYENMVIILNKCKQFAQQAGKNCANMLFSGNTGLGKTFLSTCIAKEMLNKGYTVIYMRAIKLFRLFEDERFGRINGGIDELYNCDLLIIDDLGTEELSKNNASYIHDIVSERLNSNKKMIINTNLSYKHLEEKYTRRFSSRIMDKFDFMCFYGDDIRWLKLKESLIN